MGEKYLATQKRYWFQLRDHKGHLCLLQLKTDMLFFFSTDPFAHSATCYYTFHLGYDLESDPQSAHHIKLGVAAVNVDNNNTICFFIKNLR